MYLTQTSSGDYEQLCRLDVLGLEDQPTGDQAETCEEFKEQLIRSDEGWYETGLSWKPRHPQLPNNKMKPWMIIKPCEEIETTTNATGKI